MDGIQLIDKTSISIQAVSTHENVDSFALTALAISNERRYRTGGTTVSMANNYVRSSSASSTAADLCQSFYLTFLIGQFPSNYVMQRWKIGLSLTLYMFGWGRPLPSLFPSRMILTADRHRSYLRQRSEQLGSADGAPCPPRLF